MFKNCNVYIEENYSGYLLFSTKFKLLWCKKQKVPWFNDLRNVVGIPWNKTTDDLVNILYIICVTLDWIQFSFSVLYFGIKFEVSILRKIINSLESIINNTEKGAIYRKVNKNFRNSEWLYSGTVKRNYARIKSNSNIFNSISSFTDIFNSFLVQYNSFRNVNWYMRNTWMRANQSDCMKFTKVKTTCKIISEFQIVKKCKKRFVRSPVRIKIDR